MTSTFRIPGQGWVTQTPTGLVEFRLVQLTPERSWGSIVIAFGFGLLFGLGVAVVLDFAMMTLVALVAVAFSAPEPPHWLLVVFGVTALAILLTTSVHNKGVRYPYFHTVGVG